MARLGVPAGGLNHAPTDLGRLTRPALSYPATPPRPFRDGRSWPPDSRDAPEADAHLTYRELCEEGQRLERDGLGADARRYYERALRQAGGASVGPSTSTVIRWIARTYQSEGEYDDALSCLEAAYSVAELEEDDTARGHALNLHAIIWWRQGQLDQARALYLEAREHAIHHRDALLGAMTAQNLGVIASIRGEHEQALLYYESALREYRQLGMHRDECIALNNLGMLQVRLGHSDAAQVSYREALQLAQRHEYDDVRAQLEVNLAGLTVARGDYVAAQVEVTHALTAARSRDDLNAVAEALKLAGIIARARQMYDVAEAHFREAAQIAEARQNVLLLAELHREFAVLFRAAGRNRELLRSLNTAHRLFGELKARHDLADIERSTRELEGEFIDVARKWGQSTESKDRYTQGHCERVADVACAIARHAGFDDATLFWFRIGTLLHDVGKLVIPDEVLNKPGRLTPDEWEVVKEHPVVGAQLISDIEFPWDITPIVRWHHEAWDGSGYPDRLSGEDIPLVARIVCLADVYDALTSERSYKKALPHAQAMGLMRRDVGRQFDPAVFQIFEEVMAARVEARTTPTELTGPAPVIDPGARDELTGLLMRRAFIEEASTRLRAASAEETPTPWSLAVIDVDAFKSVNDTFGHLQGDDVLRAVSQALAGGIREFDFAGRYAGDEFVLFLRADRIEASMVAERLCETVARLRVPVRGNEEGTVTVTLSIGISTAPMHGTTFEALFGAADRALYDAKRRGRNVVSLAGADGASGKPRLDLERFVGRTDEVGKLVTHFEAAVRGEPRVLAVVGEAGVGKTTLVRRIMSEVRLRTGVMVFGRSHEADVRPPYGPWMDVIAGLHGLGVVTGRAWPELERLVPRLRLNEVTDSVTPTGTKYGLLEEIVAFLRLAAAHRPLVLVLDDMQWGDTASWDATEHIVSQLEQERILVCLTIRHEDAERIEGSRQRLSRHECYHELHVPRLLPEEVHTWVNAALQQAIVGSEFPDALYRFTEGNPLFVKQVMQALFDEGLLWHNGTGWEWREIDRLALPTAIDDLMSRRLSRLAPSASKLLAVAAVFGRTFDMDDVAAAAEANEDQLLDAIDEGLRAGVIEPANPGEPSRYSFVHRLLADALKRGLNPRRLQLMQRRVAETLEVRHPHQLAEIAALYDLGGDAERAHVTALRAGESAAAVSALDDAMRAFRIAVRRATSDAGRVTATQHLLRIAQLAGRYADAEALCEDLMREPTVLNVASLRVAAERTRLEVRAQRGESPAITVQGLAALLTEARRSGAVREEVLLLTGISDIHARQGAWTDAQRLARAARDVAITLEDVELRADTIVRLGTALLDTDPASALQHFAEASTLYANIDHRFGQARCLVNVGIASQRVGAHDDAERAYRDALAMAEAGHIVDLAGLAALNFGVLLTRAGRYEQADAQLHDAMRCFRKVKSEPRRLATLYNQAHLAHEQGDAAKAHDLARAAVDLAADVGMEHVRIAALARMGLAAIALGTMTEVEDVRRELVAYCARTPHWFKGRESVEAFLARFALQQGAVAVAAEHFRVAAQALRTDPYDVAWLIAECAGLFRATRDVALRTQLADAHRTATALGYVPLARRLGSAVRASGIMPVIPAPGA